MSAYTPHWPAAFALAITLVNSSGNADAIAASDGFFQPRQLSRHLDSAVADADAAQAMPAPTRLAQWFNWFNCFSGTWRRC